MATEEPGLDQHEWESEWQALEPLVVDSPAEALPELDDLIGRMLAEAGYPVDTPNEVDEEGVDPEVMVSFRVARESRSTAKGSPTSTTSSRPSPAGSWAKASRPSTGSGSPRKASSSSMAPRPTSSPTATATTSATGPKPP